MQNNCKGLVSRIDIKYSMQYTFTFPGIVLLLNTENQIIKKSNVQFCGLLILHCRYNCFHDRGDLISIIAKLLINFASSIFKMSKIFLGAFLLRSIILLFPLSSRNQAGMQFNIQTEYFLSEIAMTLKSWNERFSKTL